MATLYKKKDRGRTYWVARQCARVNGQPRIVWEKYLGTTDAIILAVTGSLPPTAAEARAAKAARAQRGTA